MRTNNINENKYCCGCGACLVSCPRKCIDLIQDGEGFWKAHCCETECVRCNKCIQVCPFFNMSNKEHKTNTIYAAVSKEKTIYERSSSGGVFSHAARHILSCGGYVFACGYSNNIQAMHKEISSVSDLDDLCRSKYVQSYMGRIYENVQERLSNGAMILFAGTPCQIAGLKNFLNKEYNNLFLIDLVCHGVPSAGLFEKNIKYLEKKSGKPIKRYEFRKKNSKYPNIYSFTYTYMDKTEKVGPYYNDAYFNAFYNVRSLNECCYICPYACKERTGDLTIGDFEWGKKYHSEFKSYSDISCVLINTSKGKTLFDSIQNEMLVTETEWDYVLERNRNLIFPTDRPAKRDSLYISITQKGYTRWVRNYFWSFEYVKNTKLFGSFRKFKNSLQKRKGKEYE